MKLLHTFTCSIKSCGEHTLKESEWPYGWCQKCENFTICSKKDKEHIDSLLYWEGCRSHHSGGYSICRKCAKEAYKIFTKDSKYSEKEGHMCPKCLHHYSDNN